MEGSPQFLADGYKAHNPVSRHQGKNTRVDVGKGVYVGQKHAGASTEGFQVATPGQCGHRACSSELGRVPVQALAAKGSGKCRAQALANRWLPPCPVHTTPPAVITL